MLLAIDTCGAVGSVALGRVSEGQVQVLACKELAGRTYSARLIPAVAEMLDEHGATVSEVRALVVVNGPGSFTGIRVGLSAAKGLVQANGTPLVALSQLALIAQVSGLPHVLALLDAGRGEYYVGEYRAGAMVREMLLNADNTLALAMEGGAGVVVCQEQCAGPIAASKPVYVQAPDATDALRLAMPRIEAGDFDDAALLDGNYLRRSDAELFARLK